MTQGRILDPCLGPYICICINTKKKNFLFNQWCLFIKWKVEALTTLFMQNYLFNFVMQGDLWMICNVPFWQKTNSFLQLNCRYSKANNFSQVVPWPVQDYRRTYSHFPSGPMHGLWHPKKGWKSKFGTTKYRTAGISKIRNFEYWNNESRIIRFFIFFQIAGFWKVVIVRNWTISEIWCFLKLKDLRNS